MLYKAEHISAIQQFPMVHQTSFIAYNFHFLYIIMIHFNCMLINVVHLKMLSGNMLHMQF